MKNSIFLFLLLISTTVFAQNCNIGNQSSTGFTNSGDPLYKNYIMGIKFTLANADTLRSLNLIGRNTGAGVKMALYKDVAGLPGDLVVKSTNSGTVTSGAVSLAVTPTVLAAGNYWIMAVYDAHGGHTYSKTQTGTNVYYKALNYNDAVPANASDFLHYTGSTFTYFLGITCITSLGVTNATNSSVINFYPNPATDFITVNTEANRIGATYSIKNITGKQLLTGLLTSEKNIIDINILEAGMYFIIIGDKERQTIKFIKQ